MGQEGALNSDHSGESYFYNFHILEYFKNADMEWWMDWNIGYWGIEVDILHIWLLCTGAYKSGYIAYMAVEIISVDVDV